MTQHQEDVARIPELLTFEEVAALLNVSPEWVETAAYDDGMPAIILRDPERCRVHRDSLERWRRAARNPAEVRSRCRGIAEYPA